MRVRQFLYLTNDKWTRTNQTLPGAATLCTGDIPQLGLPKGVLTGQTIGALEHFCARKVPRGTLPGKIPWASLAGSLPYRGLDIDQPQTSNRLDIDQTSISHRLDIDLTSIWDQFGTNLGSIWHQFGIDLGSIQGPSGRLPGLSGSPTNIKKLKNHQFRLDNPKNNARDEKNSILAIPGIENYP